VSQEVSGERKRQNEKSSGLLRSPQAKYQQAHPTYPRPEINKVVFHRPNCFPAEKLLGEGSPSACLGLALTLEALSWGGTDCSHPFQAGPWVVHKLGTVFTISEV
jgi:hypothetical protein